MKVDTIAELIGHTIVHADCSVGADVAQFDLDNGHVCRFWHDDDCCEDVRIEDVIGDIADLVGTPLVLAEEVSDADGPKVEDVDSYTWTFYRFATVKGTVTIRWLGTSTGYYSEGVSWEITRDGAR